MRTYIFVEREDQAQSDVIRATARQVLQEVAEETDTSRLVVAVYFLSNSDIWQGELTRKPVGQGAFSGSRRRRWSFTKRFPAPGDLPESFALVRIALGSRWHRKTTLRDRAGHVMKFGHLRDQLAFLFAHELHHFRRFHLGLHHGEGETSADRWAIQRVTSLGYKIEVSSTRRRTRIKVAKAPTTSRRNAPLMRRIKCEAAKLCPEDLRDLAGWLWARIHDLEEAVARDAWADHYESLRRLPKGAKLQVVRDSVGPRRESRIGQVMTKVRTLGRGSKRIAVEDQAGRTWYWPMKWLKTVVAAEITQVASETPSSDGSPSHDVLCR